MIPHIFRGGDQLNQITHTQSTGPVSMERGGRPTPFLSKPPPSW